MTKSQRRRGSPGPFQDPQAHASQLRDHTAWFGTGRTLLNAADLIWRERIQPGFDHMAQRRADLLRAFKAGEIQAERRGLPAFQAEPLVGVLELSGYCNVYMLTAGYAVENFLKAVRVKRLVLSGRPVNFGGEPDGLPTSHTSYATVAKAELDTLTEADQELLGRLSLFVDWAGRYPVPIQPAPLSEVNGRSTKAEDYRAVQDVCQRAIDKYESLR